MMKVGEGGDVANPVVKKLDRYPCTLHDNEWLLYDRKSKVGRRTEQLCVCDPAQYSRQSSRSQVRSWRYSKCIDLHAFAAMSGMEGML